MNSLHINNKNNYVLLCGHYIDLRKTMIQDFNYKYLILLNEHFFHNL